MNLRTRPPALALAALLGLASTPGSAQDRDDDAGSTIEFVVEGLRGAGHVRAGAYDDAQTWLGDGATARCAAPVRDGRAVCVIHVPHPGTYAVAFYHDQDDDGVLDRGMFSVPTEGYGFSRNVGGGLSAPSFQSASLDVAAGARVRTVARVRYGI